LSFRSEAENLLLFYTLVNSSAAKARRLAAAAIWAWDFLWWTLLCGLLRRGWRGVVTGVEEGLPVALGLGGVVGGELGDGLVEAC